MDKKVLKALVDDIEQQVQNGTVAFEQPSNAGRICMQKLAAQLEGVFDQANEDERLMYFNAYNLLRNRWGKKLYDFLSAVVRENKEEEELGPLK